MDYTLIEAVEASAVSLLQKYREAHPQWNDDITPLQEIAHWLGLDIATFDVQDYPQGTYGFMDADDDENLIWLCRDLPTNLQRFTLAHEIGHALFHCQDGQRLLAIAPEYAPRLLQDEVQQRLPRLSHTQPCQQKEIQEDLAELQELDLLQETLGAHGYSPRSERELVANLFAAELLIPRARLAALYLREGYPTRKLASHFQVSDVALLNRLAGLYASSDFLEQATAIAHNDVAESGDDTQQQTAQEENSVQTTTAKAKHYDDYQQAAINAPTPALVVAGPGSGKTSTLIGRVEHLVNVEHIPAAQILALTFSRKATQEMEERLHQVIPDTAGFPHVSTFHAFCADLLREYGSQVGLRPDFTLIDDAEGYYILQQQTDTLHLHHYQKFYAPTQYFPDLLKIISRAKDELITPEEYAQRAREQLQRATSDEERISAEKTGEIAQVYALYEQELQRRGDTDFGGLLMLAIRLLRTQVEICSYIQMRYQHILVDEFQDVNRASGILLRELAGERQQVWVVGDANQAIYGFRGASPANIQQFTRDFPSAHIFPLRRNYRSRPDLVTIAEAFRLEHLEKSETQTQNLPVRVSQSDPYITLASASNEQHEIAGIIQDMRFKHSQGYSYRDMVVLCRTRSHVQKITRALAGANLPVIEQGGILEQEHIKDLVAFLFLLIDDSGMGLMRAGRSVEYPLNQQDIEEILLDNRKKTATEQQTGSVRRAILAGEAPFYLSSAGRHSFLRLSEIMRTIIGKAQSVWSTLAQYLLVETDIMRSLLYPDITIALNEKECRARLADYQQMLQLARHFDQQQMQRLPASSTPEQDSATARQDAGATESSLSTESLPLEEQIRGFIEYLNLLILLRQDTASRQDNESEAGNTTDTIRVMTVHASKGLEFPTVYLPGLAQQRFPATARTTPASEPIAQLTGTSNAQSHESGESCLFYVGMTRARNCLVLSTSATYGKRKYKRSPYLDIVERGIATSRIIRLEWESESTQAGKSVQADTGAVQAQQQALLQIEDGPAATGIVSQQPSERLLSEMQEHASSFSPYNIELYQSCPRKYAYERIYHFNGKSSTYQLFWHAIQKTLETLYRSTETETEQAQQIPDQAESIALYNRYWQELGGDTMPFATLYAEHGKEVIENISRRLATQTGNDTNISVELRKAFDIEVAGSSIRVSVDRLEMAQEATSATGPTAPANKKQQSVALVRTRYGQSARKPEARTRELLYTLIARKYFPEQVVFLQSHNLSTGETQPVTLTSRKEQGLYASLQQSIAGLEQHDFAARPEEPYRCPECPFFWICPA